MDIDYEEGSSWTWVFYALMTTLMIGFCSYRSFPSFRYYYKFALLIGYCSTTGFLCFIPALFRGRDTRNTKLAIKTLKYMWPMLGIEWEVEGIHHLTNDDPCIIIVNHQTMLDAPGTLMFHTMIENWKCAPVSRKELLLVFPFGLIAWICGTIFINRSNADQCKNKISASAQEIVQKGTKMLIFPEGTRSKKGELLPFKKGAFHIACQYKLPIIPLVISPYTFINDERKIFDSGKVIMSVLPPIQTNGIDTPEEVTRLTESCRELMNQEYIRLSQVVKHANRDEALSKDTKHSGNTMGEHISGSKPTDFNCGKRRA